MSIIFQHSLKQPNCNYYLDTENYPSWQFVASGEVSIHKIDTKEQCADMLTKSLNKEAHEKHQSRFIQGWTLRFTTHLGSLLHQETYQSTKLTQRSTARICSLNPSTRKLMKNIKAGLSKVGDLVGLERECWNIMDIKIYTCLRKFLCPTRYGSHGKQCQTFLTDKGWLHHISWEGENCPHIMFKNNKNVEMRVVCPREKKGKSSSNTLVLFLGITHN